MSRNKFPVQMINSRQRLVNNHNNTSNGQIAQWRRSKNNSLKIATNWSGRFGVQNALFLCQNLIIIILVQIWKDRQLRNLQWLWTNYAMNVYFYSFVKFWRILILFKLWLKYPFKTKSIFIPYFPNY